MIESVTSFEYNDDQKDILVGKYGLKNVFGVKRVIVIQME